MLAFLLIWARDLLRIRWRDVPYLVLLGAVFFTIFPVTFNTSLRLTEASRGALMLATMPLWSVLIARAAKKERRAAPDVRRPADLRRRGDGACRARIDLFRHRPLACGRCPHAGDRPVRRGVWGPRKAHAGPLQGPDRHRLRDGLWDAPARAGRFFRSTLSPQCHGWVPVRFCSSCSSAYSGEPSVIFCGPMP